MDKEYELRGFYRPNFFSIFINGEYSKDLNEISKSDFGTFVHEYIHYLQNITTILGLRSSTLYFDYLYFVKKHIQESESIRIPIDDQCIKLPESIIKSRTRFSILNGTNKIYSPLYDNVNVSINEIHFNGKIINQVQLNLFYNKTKVDTIILGNKCVKESMANLFQELFDDNIKPHIFPYKSVEILCVLINPDLLKDKRKLIALCYLSLNAQNSGFFLYQLLLESKRYNALNGVEIYKCLSKKYPIIISGKSMSVQDTLIESLKLFRIGLSGSILTPLVFLDQLLTNIETLVQNNEVPLIECLYEDFESVDIIQKLINSYGIPHIDTINRTTFFPNEPPAKEFIELLAQRIVFDRIFEIDQRQICGLYPICDLSETPEIDDNCFEKQWKRTNECFFSIMSDNFGLRRKISD
jgi:hypothetical protein